MSVDEIKSIASNGNNADIIAAALVDKAFENGGTDNITAVVMKPFHEEVKVC